ncbi:TetR/AcrR family transcriptional regulator [Granulosicoccus antarcticus]|uniref:HTH-type transcriptional regulator EthR n=1 Tax=Granulosicoccus antarcticus IMCC3135 TaxID=1192854 RepID=A0A2Z2NNW0_9GAMM|nr:TetR/AcrR family transcriptional regulator [Granulosicoccus antarcticus]ASJ72919.1 HTH-type transcriptional regulator EthR [Granulosicoccus antarcticus IMCC3135]
MTDARQIRTKQAILDTLDSMLSEMPYGDVQVKELAGRAGIGRQTFYRHFDSVDAVIYERLRADLADQMAFALEHVQAHNPEEWLLEVTRFAFEKVATQPHLARILLSGEAGPDVLRLFREQILELWRVGKADSLMASVELELRPFAASFKAGALCGILLHWIEAGCSPDARTMSRLFHDLAMPATQGS